MTYSWEVDEPVDSTFAASSIHTQIQADKIAMRERFEAPNAAFNEHGDADATAVGVHISSKVGWARASTSRDRLSTGLKVGSLHWFTDESLMCVINEDSKFVVINVTDHTLLEGLTDDDHVMYVLKDGTCTMTGDITLDGGTLQPEAYPTADSVALDPAHASESWYTAHGADSVQDRHIEDGVVSEGSLAVDNYFTRGAFAFPSDYFGMVLSKGSMLDIGIPGSFPLVWNVDGQFGRALTGGGYGYAEWHAKEMVSS